jgi:uncharacterized protein (TIGR03000 family)
VIVAPAHAAAPVAAPAVAAAQQATVTVKVPEGAKFSVDGKEVAVATPEQTFLTPALEASRTYYYEMKASTKKDGKELSASQRVAIKAGEKVTVDLRDVKPWSAPKENKDETARVQIRLPKDAQLYVDGVLIKMDGEEGTFRTPTLVPGKPYYYTFKAELDRDGDKVSETQKVTVEAGRTVAVEFEKFPVRTAGR